MVRATVQFDEIDTSVDENEIDTKKLESLAIDIENSPITLENTTSDSKK
jgi:hypothetical protein